MSIGEPGSTETAGRVPQVPEIPRGILICVVRYDNLLDDVRGAFEVLSEQHDHVVLGRGSTETKGIRFEGSLVSIPDAKVSGVHATLKRRRRPRKHDDELTGMVEDLLRDGGEGRPQSKNGTWLNGDRLAEGEWRPLLDGDMVEVGHTLFCYRTMDSELSHRLTYALPGGVPFGLTTTFCPAVIRAADRLRAAAAAGSRILIHGGTGVGKEGAAAFAHQHSGRPTGPFVAVNCAATPGSLFEQHFFGHEKGAFTGSAGRRRGYVEEAEGGTLFLDEVGSLPREQQAALLRIVQSARYRPLGAEEDRPADVRWVAATNENIDERLRSDLRFRLAQTLVELPSLLDRREDIGAVVVRAARRAAPRAERVTIDPSFARTFFLRCFEGNLRELDDVVAIAIASAGATKSHVHLDASHFPAEAGPSSDQRTDERRPPVPAARSEHARNTEGADTMYEGGLSEKHLRDAMKRGTKTAAARALGITPRHLDRLLKRYGLDVEYRRRPMGSGT